VAGIRPGLKLSKYLGRDLTGIQFWPGTGPGLEFRFEFFAIFGVYFGVLGVLTAAGEFFWEIEH